MYVFIIVLESSKESTLLCEENYTFYLRSKLC